MNEYSTEQQALPRSSFLDTALRRARSAAEQRSHRYVTLEHLLFALMDDPDAKTLLEQSGADMPLLRTAVADAVNHRMASLVTPTGGVPSFSYKFDTLMDAAAAEAARMGLHQIDGAAALIALAKEQGSNAALILEQHGFRPFAPNQQATLAPVSPRETIARPEPPQYIATPNGEADRSGKDNDMNETLSRVRGILDAEPGPINQPSTPYPQQTLRAEPQFSGGSGEQRLQQPQFYPGAPMPGPGPERDNRFREEPRLGADVIPAHEPMHQPPAPQAASRNGDPRKQRRRRSSRPASAAFNTVLELIPRRMRRGVPKAVEISVSPEDAIHLFEAQHGGPSASHGAPVMRAISFTLFCIEAGLAIEMQSPETQWLFDRPSFLGSEPFGTWRWTILPDYSGRYRLILQGAMRTIDEHGVASDIKLPDATVSVRVSVNYWRFLGNSISFFLKVLLGFGLAAGALFAMKSFGKLALIGLTAIGAN